MGRSIDNPVINGPYDEPGRHFRFDDDGITDQVVNGRRRSEHFIPIPPARKKKGQVQETLDFEWTADRIEPNGFVNEVRGFVQVWRRQGYPNVTPTTRRLLQHWADPVRDNRVLFAQREVAETAIFLVEAAQNTGSVGRTAPLPLTC